MTVCSVDAGVCFGLQFGGCRFGLCPQPVEPISFELELVDPILGLAQLGRESVRECRSAVAILVRQVRRLLQLLREGEIGLIGGLAREIAHQGGRLTFAHDC